MIFGLTMILILVLFLPFYIKQVEQNLEAFLFVMGLATTVISGVLDRTLWLKALQDPIQITLAVLLAGTLFKWFHRQLEKTIHAMSNIMSLRMFLALFVMFLGLVSSMITAIIASLVLVAVASILKLDRKSELQFVVLACFSIGLGAALTPIGEPLSTIVVSKLNEDFFYLIHLIGLYIIPAVAIFGLLTAVIVKPKNEINRLSNSGNDESYLDIIVRSLKIYLFVMGLTLLGAGFEPFIERYLLHLSPYILYWINMISAILDNATLAAAEVSPAMNTETLQAILLGLLISGGMLVPGNIPNIIAAGKLNITSKEWARFGIPIGLIAMFVYFLVILIV